MFYEALKKKLKGVIAATKGITAQDPATAGAASETGADTSAPAGR